MKHMMIDIETLGRNSDASVISIGACMFNLEEVGTGDKIFYVNIADDGRDVDPDTVRWWLKQSKEAQETLFTPEPIYMKEARKQLRAFIEKHKPDYIWANGSLFDLNILRHWFGGHPPWNFRQEMCMRSIRVLGASLGVNYSDYFNDELVAHNALDDATRQAQYVIDVFEEARR